MKLILAMLLALPAFGQSTAFDRLTPQLPTANERKAADIASYVTDAILVGLDTRASWKCEHRVRCFEMQGIRIGVVYGSAYAAKTLVGRTRPCSPVCGSLDGNNASFFSAHTALAFSSLGADRYKLTVPLAIGTGGLRVMAGKHWLTDVIAGAIGGGVVNKWLR